MTNDRMKWYEQITGGGPFKGPGVAETLVGYLTTNYSGDPSFGAPVFTFGALANGEIVVRLRSDLYKEPTREVDHQLATIKGVIAGFTAAETIYNR